MRITKTITPDDLHWLHDLNEACTPEVGSVTLSRLTSLLEMAALAAFIEEDGEPLGAMLVLTPDSAYDSPYFLWFKERFEGFLYLDRIMVSEAARGLGVGKALHKAFFDFAIAQKAARLACDVNLLPPNPVSLAFHKASGFEVVGRLDSNGGAKAVQMMVKEL